MLLKFMSKGGIVKYSTILMRQYKLILSEPSVKRKHYNQAPSSMQLLTSQIKKMFSS